MPQERKEATNKSRVIRVEMSDPNGAISSERTRRPSPVEYLAIVEDSYILAVIYS